LEQKRPCVYCCVVETRGSTPQKAGAAMIVYADGGQAGTLGGGCVEAEVWAEAREAMRRVEEDMGQPVDVLRQTYKRLHSGERLADFSRSSTLRCSFVLIR
jgi:xanthine/CO dehydrogenase XdhC/CoxF family maturation factor